MSRTRERILELLRGRDDFFSGEELSRELGVSRTVVWKEISRLRAEGMPIEAVTRRGYRLRPVGEEDGYGQRRLREVLSSRCQWVTPLFREETVSTNTDVMTLADEGAPEGTLAIAARQTGGKGRRGRQWISPMEGNIYMSLLLRPELPIDTAPSLTLVMAMAVTEALRGGEVPFAIKWPNDVVGRDPADGQWKKVCGILTELRLEEGRIRDVTIGVGINVNMASVPEEIRATAASVRMLTGADHDRVEIVERVMHRFGELYHLFLEAGGFAPLKASYEEMLVNRGGTVKVLDPAGEYTGVATGINDRGELMVALEDGSLREIRSGEVSVRGVEGYV